MLSKTMFVSPSWIHLILDLCLFKEIFTLIFILGCPNLLLYSLKHGLAFFNFHWNLSILIPNVCWFYALKAISSLSSSNSHLALNLTNFFLLRVLLWSATTIGLWSGHSQLHCTLIKALSNFSCIFSISTLRFGHVKPPL